MVYRPWGRWGQRRSFGLLDMTTGRQRGRFRGHTPLQAASKAFTSAVKSCERAGTVFPREIYIREQTRGSFHKIFKYRCRRILLNYPQTIRIGQQEITYRYRNSISRMAYAHNPKVNSTVCKNTNIDNLNLPIDDLVIDRNLVMVNTDSVIEI